MRKQVDKQALFKPEHWDALQAELAVNPTYDVSNVHHVVITHLVLKSMGMTNDAKRREFLARISNGKAKLDVMRSRGRVFAIELLKQLKSNLPDSRSTFRWPRGIEGATGVISNDDIRVSAMTLVPGTDNRSIYANVFFTATPPDNEHNRNNFGRIVFMLPSTLQGPSNVAEGNKQYASDTIRLLNSVSDNTVFKTLWMPSNFAGTTLTAILRNRTAYASLVAKNPDCSYTEFLSSIDTLIKNLKEMKIG